MGRTEREARGDVPWSPDVYPPKQAGQSPDPVLDLIEALNALRRAWAAAKELRFDPEVLIRLEIVGKQIDGVIDQLDPPAATVSQRRLARLAARRVRPSPPT